MTEDELALSELPPDIRGQCERLIGFGIVRG
jgi:hypothetical protein